MGRKRENPEKNHLTHPQAELGLSQVVILSVSSSNFVRLTEMKGTIIIFYQRLRSILKKKNKKKPFTAVATVSCFIGCENESRIGTNPGYNVLIVTLQVFVEVSYSNTKFKICFSCIIKKKKIKLSFKRRDRFSTGGQLDIAVVVLIEIRCKMQLNATNIGLINNYFFY